jgi:LCP family protein required for cell wall assembly
MSSGHDEGGGLALLDGQPPGDQPQTDRSPAAPPRRRWISRHKTLTALIGLLVLSLIVFSALLVWLTALNHKLDQIERFDLNLGNDRPPVIAGGRGENFLLIGVDDGHEVNLKDMLASGDWRPGIFRSDTIMVAHRSGDGSKVEVVSVPRDSYVDIPGSGLNKINAAFSYGGPALLGRTVERVTGLRIDHVVIVDFQGFAGITDAVGGVPVYLPDDVVDPRSGETTWHRGWERVRGERALQYVRTRYGLPRGDFDRVQRQQNLLRAVLDGVTRTSVLTNPLKLTSLVDQVTSHLAVDSGLSNDAVRSLAWSMRNTRPRDIDFVTAPNAGSAMVDGASIVRLQVAELRKLCRAMDRDRLDGYLATHQVDTLPGPEHVD